jgi:Protein of unknown function (DUF4019)
MRRKLLCIWACLCASLLAVACGAQRDLAASDTAVTHFHQLLDGQDYASIYTQADQKFRDATKRDDFVALMTAVHRKLGQVGSAARTGFFVNYNTSGSQIRVSYATKFSEGDAEEQFVWSKSGDKLVLLGYHINSIALITK